MQWYYYYKLVVRCNRVLLITYTRIAVISSEEFYLLWKHTFTARGGLWKRLTVTFVPD